MGKKINVAELLKDCPNGMELDCALFEDVKFSHVEIGEDYPIKINLSDGFEISLSEYGDFLNRDDSKCVIFPKGKTTWEGFVPPYKFKDGDVVHVMSKKGVRFVFIFKEIKNELLYSYADLSPHQIHVDGNPVCPIVNVETMRLATEEEKHELFDAIKDGGYKWNAETKTLEMLKVEKTLQNNVEEKIFNYLISELYSLPSCDNCHYNAPYINKQEIRLPCNFCNVHYSKFKLRGGIIADISKMVKWIMKIVKE